MKTAQHPATLTITALCLCAALTAGGCKQEPPAEPAKPLFSFVTTKDLFGVGCADSNRVWIVGFDAAIYHSADGGKTWSTQKAPVTNNLCDVSFVSPEVGWICGRAGVVLHTEDGGKTWARQDTGTDNHLFGLSFVDPQHGWAVGDLGTIIHTADGGRTWVSQAREEDRIYNDVFFTSAREGWIAGEYGLIYHTADGGQTWEQQECPEIIPVTDETEWELFPPSLYSVNFADSRRGWISGMDATVIATTDGGQSWKKLPNPAAASKVTLYGIQSSEDSLCVIGQKGTSLHSADLGASWHDRSETTDTKFWLRALSLCGDNTGFAVGSRGTILKTEDGGQSWRMLSGIPLSLNKRS